MADNTQIILKARPEGALARSHFETRRGPMPVPEAGQVLVRSVLLSLDAANRAWMAGPTYKDAVNPGDVMHGYALCEVLESRADGFAPGDLVECEAGWQEYAAPDARACGAAPNTGPSPIGSRCSASRARPPTTAC